MASLVTVVEVWEGVHTPVWGCVSGHGRLATRHASARNLHLFALRSGKFADKVKFPEGGARLAKSESLLLEVGQQPKIRVTYLTGHAIAGLRKLLAIEKPNSITTTHGTAIFR